MGKQREVVDLLDSSDELSSGEGRGGPAHGTQPAPATRKRPLPPAASTRPTSASQQPQPKRQRSSQQQVAKSSQQVASDDEELQSSQEAAGRKAPRAKATTKGQLTLTTSSSRPSLVLSLSQPPASQPCNTAKAANSRNAAPKAGAPGTTQAPRAANTLADVWARNTRQAKPAPAAAAAAYTATGATQQHHQEDAPKESDAAAECWLDKHGPRSSEELCVGVAKKKVAELHAWMEGWLPAHRAAHPGMPRMLLLTGPAGCGKSTAVRVVAAELGFQLVEWAPTTPTLWNETLYQRLPWTGEGGHYTSKLDEFAAFVARAKFPALTFSSAQGPQRQQPHSVQAGASQQANTAGGGSSSQQGDGQAHGPACGPKLLLLDDLPHVHDPAKRAELCGLLRDLATTARSPVLLIATETTGMAGANGGVGSSAALSDSGLHRDVQAALQSAGAGILAFNPVTDANAAKVLLRIAEAEQQPLSAEAVAQLAKAAGGDLRNAVQSLQLMFGQAPPAQEGPRKTKAPARKGRAASSTAGQASRSRSTGRGAAGAGKQLLPHEEAKLTAVQRDMGLQLFHALGKLLYNKRDASPGEGGGEDGMQVEAQLAGDTQPSQLARSSTQQGGKRGTGKAAGGARGKAAVGAAAAPGTGALRGMPSLAFTEDLLDPSLRRPPMRYDPEAITMNAGLEPLPLVAFLHANYLSFMGQQEMQDTADAAAYLSDAAYLCCYRSSTSGGYAGYWGEEVSTAANLTAACASSVAARGLLFANQRPAPNRFHAMQGSLHTQVEKAAAANLGALAGSAQQLVRHSSSTANGGGCLLAAQVLPCLRALSSAPSHRWLSAVMPSSWTYFYNGQVTQHQQQGARQLPDAEQLAVELSSAALADDDPIEA